MLLDPTATRIEPGNAGFGLHRRSPAAVARRRRVPPPPRALLNLVRPIRNQRSRLDRSFIRSKPLDPDPAAWIHAYRFSLGILLKRPQPFRISTRSPCLCKHIYRSTQIFTRNPLTFPDFKPAVQHLVFCTLALISNLYLCLGPQFLQKSPWNPVFLTNKPLNLVLGLVYAF